MQFTCGTMTNDSFANIFTICSNLKVKNLAVTSKGFTTGMLIADSFNEEFSLFSALLTEEILYVAWNMKKKLKLKTNPECTKFNKKQTNF